MTFAELPERAAFTWRDHFPDHVLMIKKGDRAMAYFGRGEVPAIMVGDDLAVRRVRRWTISRDSMDEAEIESGAVKGSEIKRP